MITINMDKARVIAHDKRRASRAAEFEPFDEVIAKQIPGASAAEAEAARQEISEKYVTIQNEINIAADIKQLTEIVSSL